MAVDSPARRDWGGIVHPKDHEVGGRYRGQVFASDRHRRQSGVSQDDGDRRGDVIEAVLDEQHPRSHWVAPPSSELSICLTTLTGMANPTPTLPAIGLSIESLIPITWPWVLSSAPPELPGLIGASVWIRPESPDAALCRLRPDTMPAVIDSGSPNGAPMAYTWSPTRTLLEFPSGSGCKVEAAADTRTTARSALVFELTSVAVRMRPSLNVTWIWLAPATTCALVRMSPLVLSTIPDPVPSPTRPKRPATSVVIVTTPGAAC